MRVALIGYGEVGRILAEDLCAGGHGVAAFDTQPQFAVHVGVRKAASHADAVTDALADAGAVGQRAGSGLARSNDWRIESDRLLAHPKESKRT